MSMKIECLFYDSCKFFFTSLQGLHSLVLSKARTFRSKHNDIIIPQCHSIWGSCPTHCLSQRLTRPMARVALLVPALLTGTRLRSPPPQLNAMSQQGWRSEGCQQWRLNDCFGFSSIYARRTSQYH
jgi:hypothetical protein